MVEAYFYMFFVGSGLASGFACVGLIVWKIVKRKENKTKNKKLKGVVA